MYDVLLLASLVVFGAVVAAYLRHPAACLAHPATFYLAFHGFVFVLRPLVARWYRFDFVYRLYDFQPSTADKIAVILATNLAMLVFVGAALRIAGAPPVSGPTGEGVQRIRAALARPILLTAAILSPAALWAQLGNWQLRVSNFETMVRDAATGASINMQGNGWFTDAALMMAPLAVMMVWLSRYRWWGWLYFAVFAFLQSGTGTRHALIFAVAAIAIAYLLEHGRRWFDWRGVALALFAAVAFNQIVIDRGGFIRAFVADDLGTAYIDGQDLDPLEHMDFANLEYFEYIVYVVPQRSGTYDYFAHMLQIATEPVPRALWPGKPVGSPIQPFSFWDYGSPIGMTASVPGVGWMSLGYPGVLIQALIFALLYGGLYRWLLMRRHGALANLAYALGIATAILGFRDGTLLSLLRVLPFYFGPLVLALVLARIAGFGLAPQPPSPGARPATAGDGPAQRRRALAAQAVSRP